MGKRDDTVSMLTKGMTPGRIAASLGVTISTTLGYLDEMVGRGAIRRSDILFSIPTNERTAIFAALSNGTLRYSSAVVAELARQGIEVSENDITVVQKYGDAAHALGDIYEDIRTIEVRLHQVVRQCLENEFGEDDNGWWRQGIPRNIRGKCGERRESEDVDPADHAYCYTDLIDLKEIINKNWQIMRDRLPTAATENKKQLLHDFERVNLIRRKVMHPVRGDVPDEDDFAFLRDLKGRLGFVLNDNSSQRT